MECNIPFIQLWNKFRPQGGRQPETDRYQRGRAAQHQPAEPHGHPQRGPVERFGAADYRAFLFADLAPHKDRNSGGHHGQ